MLRHPLTAKFLRTGLFDGLCSFDELEHRISKINVPSAAGDGDASKKARGDAFEVFVAAFLATQRSQLVDSLWPSMQLVPPSLRRRLGWKPDDKGADGLLKTASGELRGYQAKFRTGRASLPWGEVATFFGYTDRCDDRLLVTNSISVAEVAEERSDFLSLRGNDFDQLGPADFKTIVEWLKGGTPRSRPKATPRPHQKVALAAIRKSFAREDRGTVVSACGSGKTYLALWAAEALGRKSVIVLLPSLALIRQTLRDWANDTNWKRFDYLCVCSDATVSQGEDSLVVRPTELPFSVSTDAAKVRKFLRHPFDGVKVVFTTYQSAPIVSQAMSRGDAFDFGIFDEAHKTAGAEGKQNAFALSDRNLRIRKRLFLTATPKKHRLPTKASDCQKDLEPVYSMDQPEVYGPLVHKLSFGEAADRGIICKYKVIISVVTSSSAEQTSRNRGVVMVSGNLVKAPQVVNQLAIAQAVRKHRIRKAFTFHRNLLSAASFVSEGKEGVGTHLADFKTFHVSGKMSTALREAELKEFQQANRGLVSNVKCLTEGVDVPAVDMVAFMSPKRSKVDIVQAVGRAMRTSPETGKTVGYILVPLHVELKQNESIEDAVTRAGFDDVWQVLAAMQEQDDVLDEAVQRIQAERKLGKGFNDSLFQQRVEILGPPIALAALRKAVTIQCLDRLSRPWDEYVQMLLAFRKKYRHLRVPLDAPKPWQDLAGWVHNIRLMRRRTRQDLSQERINALNAIGFTWKFDGETLDSTDGLLTEKGLIRLSGISSIHKYCRKGLITPIGYAITKVGVGPYYHPRQIDEFKKSLGVTLNSTKGLLSENEFRAKSGLTKIERYRERGLIKPFGYALASGSRGVGTYYHPRQIAELKQSLGITLTSTKGLVTEKAMRRITGLSRIARYRKKGLIKPLGYAITKAGISPFYHPRQAAELKKAMGITLDSTKGLLNESQFIEKSGISTVAKCRRDGLIKPVGYAPAGPAISPFYHPRQIKDLKKALGVTLDSTKGLLNEYAVRRMPGLSQLREYRVKGLIKPLGWALGGKTGLKPYYHPRQIKELKRTLVSNRA
jgi:superfamily II DNA or RNA helicase